MNEKRLKRALKKYWFDDFVQSRFRFGRTYGKLGLLANRLDDTFERREYILAFKAIQNILFRKIKNLEIGYFDIKKLFGVRFSTDNAVFECFNLKRRLEKEHCRRLHKLIENARKYNIKAIRPDARIPWHFIVRTNDTLKKKYPTIFRFYDRLSKERPQKKKDKK